MIAKLQTFVKITNCSNSLVQYTYAIIDRYFSRCNSAHIYSNWQVFPFVAQLITLLFTAIKVFVHLFPFQARYACWTILYSIYSGWVGIISECCFMTSGNQPHDLQGRRIRRDRFSIFHTVGTMVRQFNDLFTAPGTNPSCTILCIKKTFDRRYYILLLVRCILSQIRILGTYWR